jgi:hypothetical protein
MLAALAFAKSRAIWYSRARVKHQQSARINGYASLSLLSFNSTPGGTAREGGDCRHARVLVRISCSDESFV